MYTLLNANLPIPAFVKFPTLHRLHSALAGFVLAAATLLFAAHSAAQQNAAPAASTPAPAAAPSLPANARIISCVRFAPPQILARDLMGVARQVYPGMQTELFPLLLLGKYGYPTFSGVSVQVPVASFLFGGPDLEDQGIVYMAVLTADSPARAALSASMDSVTDPATGWTFFSTNAGLLALAQANAAALAKVAAQPFAGDFEWTLPTQQLDLFRADVQGVMQAQLTSLVLPPDAAKWTDFSLQELGSLQAIRVILDCKSDAIRLTVLGAGKSGTALAELFSTPPAAPVPGAQFISADAPVVGVFRTDAPALQNFLNHLFADARAASSPGSQPMLDDLQKGVDLYLSHSDGTAVATLSWPGTGKASLQFLAGSASANDTLVQQLNFLSQAAAPAVNQRLGPLAGDATAPLSSNGLYFGAAPGYFASASSPQNLSTLLQAVQSNQPAANNLATAFVLKPGVLMVGKASPGILAAGLSSSGTLLPAASPDTLAALRSSTLPPVTFSAMTGNNQAQLQVTVPVSSIVDVFRILNSPPAPPSAIQPAPASSAPSPSAPAN